MYSADVLLHEWDMEGCVAVLGLPCSRCAEVWIECMGAVVYVALQMAMMDAD